MKDLDNLSTLYPNAFNGHFYFECQNGWYDIIEPIVIAISKYNDENEGKLYPSQVKEKFGTLRFYTNFYTDEIEKLIDEAENLSEVICEQCGKPGVLYPNRWYYVACNEHARPIDLENYGMRK